MARPIDTVNQLVDAINQGDLDRAVAAYEAGAVLVAQPGQLARGSIQIREALAGFIVLQATLETEAQELIEAGDLALYVGRWSLRGTDPNGKPVAMAGESADVLRRQQDGRWRIAVDNPWGAGILGSRG
jgi:ketosteroid isomerase-like protein